MPVGTEMHTFENIKITCERLGAGLFFFCLLTISIHVISNVILENARAKNLRTYKTNKSLIK